MAAVLPQCPADRGDDVCGCVLALLRRQDDHIWLTQSALYRLGGDFLTAGTETFAHFLRHFWAFVRQHYASEGFSDALRLLQVTDGSLFERLVGGKILGAAEQLAYAVAWLEKLLPEETGTDHPLQELNDLLCQVEATQLQIMQVLEKVTNRPGQRKNLPQ